MKTVEIFLNIGKTVFSENPEGHRKFVFQYTTSLIDPEEAAEEAYCITNAPSLLLTQHQYNIRCQYYERAKRPIATGDCVVVDDEIFLCLNEGWKKLQYDES